MAWTKSFFSTRLFVLLCFSSSLAGYCHEESWYWGFGIGPSTSQYKQGTYKITQSSAAIDLGFYFPLPASSTTVIGPAISGASDGGGALSEHTRSLLAFSIMHTFGPEPGDGFFLRGDIGFGSLTFDVFNRSSGFGLLAGAGYGFAVSDETRLLLQGRLELISTSSAQAQAFSVVFGPLF